MQRGRRELHPHLVRDLIQRHQVRRILVLHRHAEAHILHPHLAQLLQRRIAPLVAVVQAANLVVRLLQALYRDTDANLRELLAEIQNPVREESVRRDYDAVALLVQFPHHLLQVRADKRFAARDVRKVHLWQLLDGLNRDFLLRLARCLIAVTHRATRVTPVRHDDRTVQFLFSHIFKL